MADLADAIDPDLDAAVWDLAPLVDGEGDDGARRLLAHALDLATDFASADTGRVAELDADALVRAVHQLTEIRDLLQRVTGYADRRGLADVSDPAWAALQATVEPRCRPRSRRVVRRRWGLLLAHRTEPAVLHPGQRRPPAGRPRPWPRPTNSVTACIANSHAGAARCSTSHRSR